MLDILFGNDENAVSFITTKNNLGIVLDNTDSTADLRATKNYDLTRVEVFGPREEETTVNIENIVSNDTAVYAALTQVGDSIIFVKGNEKLSFNRDSNLSLIHISEPTRPY